MIRIANKPLLEFFIEYCAARKIKEIRFVMEEPEIAVEKYFGDGAKWNLKITYGTSRSNDSLESILERNRLLLADDDLLIINGFFFLHYDIHTAEPAIVKGDKDWRLIDENGYGLYFVKKLSLHHGWNNIKFEDYKDKDVELHPLDTVKQLYTVNMEMVHGDAEKYIMPSYNNESGVFIGQNVEIMQDCDVHKPVILGNNIQLKSFSKIGPCAIIGDNSLVDTNTIIQHSVIYGDSYIGAELEINKKIIYKRRIIDPESGEALDIVDNFLVSEIDSRFIREFGITAIHSIVAALMLVCQLPLFLLLRPFVSGPDKVCECWNDKSGNTKLKLAFYERFSKNIMRKLFLKFSLDKYHLIFLCLLGRLSLAGSRPMEATDDNLHFINQMPIYRPAVFSYSGMLEHEDDEFQCRIDELYYSHHSGVSIDIRIIIQSLVSRLFRHIE
jgi:NDP-sugar pyrophosphorylase family protein